MTRIDSLYSTALSLSTQVYQEQPDLLIDFARGWGFEGTDARQASYFIDQTLENRCQGQDEAEVEAIIQSWVTELEGLTTVAVNAKNNQFDIAQLKAEYHRTTDAKARKALRARIRALGGSVKEA